MGYIQFPTVTKTYVFKHIIIHSYLMSQQAST